MKITFEVGISEFFESVRADGKFIGLRDFRDGQISLHWCPACGKENYITNRHTGLCYACGWDVNGEEPDEVK